MPRVLRSSSDRDRRAATRLRSKPPSVVVTLELLLMGGYVGVQMQWTVEQNMTVRTLHKLLCASIKSWGHDAAHAQLYRKVGSSCQRMPSAGTVGNYSRSKLAFCAVLPQTV